MAKEKKCPQCGTLMKIVKEEKNGDEKIVWYECVVRLCKWTLKTKVSDGKQQ